MAQSSSSKIVLHVIHAKYLRNRVDLFRNLIVKLSEGQLIESVVMHEDNDPHHLTSEHMNHFTAQPLGDSDPHAYFNSAIQTLAMTQVSNCLKHKGVLTTIASANDPLHLVIEDDVLYSENVVAQLQDAIKMYVSGSVLFLGVPTPRSPDAQTPTMEQRNVSDFYKVLPCCDAYLVNSVTASRLLPSFDKMRFANHVQMSFAALKSDVVLKCVSPNVFVDGSKYGVFSSNLELNNRLVFNPKYNMMLQTILAVKDNAPRNKDIDDMFAKFDFKSNPEIYFLKARYETKLGNYVFAKALYAYAYKLYQNDGTPLTRGSLFMQEYMKLHRHFQCV